MRLSWHHTEFGRRTDCGSFRVVRHGTGWRLLNAEWDPLTLGLPTIEAAQQAAERIAARHVPRETSQSSQTSRSSQK